MQAEAVTARSSDTAVGAATENFGFNVSETTNGIETPLFTRASSMTPASQQPKFVNPVDSAGVKKRRGRPRTGAVSESHDLKQSKKVIIQLEIQAGGDDYPRITIQATRQRRRKSSNPKKAT